VRIPTQKVAQTVGKPDRKRYLIPQQLWIWINSLLNHDEDAISTNFEQSMWIWNVRLTQKHQFNSQLSHKHIYALPNNNRQYGSSKLTLYTT
jgi:hypothetical protein